MPLEPKKNRISSWNNYLVHYYHLKQPTFEPSWICFPIYYLAYNSYKCMEDDWLVDF